MGRRKQSGLEDAIEVTARLPWWVGLVLAIVSYFFLHSIATTEIAVTGGVDQMGEAVGKQLYVSLATFGQYLLPFIFFVGAVVSLVKQLVNRKTPGTEGLRQGASEGPSIRKEENSRVRSSREPEDTLHYDSWGYELIDSLEWRRFEELCAGYFSAKGYDTRITALGADGGIDIFLYKPDRENPLGIVQCKAWNARNVGVKPVRELYGVMAAEQVPLGVFITSGEFTADARKFSEEKHVQLITGNDLLDLIRKLPQEKQAELLAEVTKGDYMTPTCPSCGIKMIKRTAQRGGNKGNQFWGCANFPNCKLTISIRADK
jgi:restriction system protein